MTAVPEDTAGAHTQPPGPEALRNSWSKLGDSIAAFGDWALRCDNAIDRAEGIRHALRYLSHLADSLIECNDPQRPEAILVQTPTRKFFGDAADCNYYLAKISGSEEYRVHGRRGDTPFFSAQLHRSTGDSRVAGTLVITPDLCDADGEYEFYLSPELGDRPGLVMDESCGELLLRDYAKFPETQTRPTIEIERLGQPAGPRPPLAEAQLAHRVDLAAKGLRLARRWLAELVETLQARPNQLHHAWAADDRAFSFFYGTPTNHYIAGWWDLSAAKALEVKLRPPAASYVGVDLYNRWFESLDSRDRRTHLNDAHLVPDEDGTIPVRIGPEPEPGNWLDPCGHADGIVVIRYIQHEETGELATPTLRPVS
ncbi:DUF1214 domain-containing protein [Amycolatopsis rubida]|uniref:Uncharacterized protein n=1 Tax=Amycolatopsis rubida TaxID=112413 RepID=A0A1I5ZGR0_9PSEU|nr:DUF1214 domain-containing protein [Amycolatopsis rubida]SFQ55600.1 Protein of unknown function [Amycolatopsis rubida]